MSASSAKAAKKDFLIREVVAPTIMDAVRHLDELNKSFYDMYVISVRPSEERDGYVTIKLVSWLNSDSREVWLC